MLLLKPLSGGRSANAVVARSIEAEILLLCGLHPPSLRDTPFAYTQDNTQGGQLHGAKDCSGMRDPTAGRMRGLPHPMLGIEHGYRVRNDDWKGRARPSTIEKCIFAHSFLTGDGEENI